MNCVSLSLNASVRKASHALVALLLVAGACDGGKDGTGSATESNMTTETTVDPTDTTADPTDSTTETTGPDETTETTETPTTGPAEMVSYTADVQPIWDANCTTSCHVAGGTGATWFLITPDESYEAIVGKNSLSFSSLVLVDPGDRENSYLWHKINGTHVDVGGGGTQMPPPPAEMLSSDDLNTIGAWIDQGANP